MTEDVAPAAGGKDEGADCQAVGGNFPASGCGIGDSEAVSRYDCCCKGYTNELEKRADGPWEVFRIPWPTPTCVMSWARHTTITTRISRGKDNGSPVWACRGLLSESAAAAIVSSLPPDSSGFLGLDISLSAAMPAFSTSCI